jgi:tetratricopeptide (TPR) repeat protein
MGIRSGVWVVLAIISSAAAAHASRPAALDKPAFTATPAELLEAAKAAPAGDWPVVMLRHDEELSVDDQGRFARRTRLVYVVRTQAGLDEWDAVESSWSPYYQDRPRMRARVVEPGGAVAELDPKLVTDAPELQTAPSVYSDRRRLAAPLPRLQIGGIVEYEVVATDHRARLAAGDIGFVAIGSWVPTSSTRVALSAPAARKAKHLAHELPGGAKPIHSIEHGRETWSYAFGALAPLGAFEMYVPGDGPARPYVGLSTAASWSAIAREYGRLVDRRIADGPALLPAELPRKPTIEAVRAITAWLHRRVRYTGIELGHAAITPWPPAETMQRGFGDCKDKATLLVALLRQAGLRADVALLDTGPGRDTDAELPGLRPFDHAIVRARVGGRDVWIDATEDLLLPGRLPAADQGRRALIAADETTGLVLTPASTAADNTVRRVRTVELSEFGPATRVTEVAREGGVFEAQRRRGIRDARAEDLKQIFTSQATLEHAVYARHSTTPPEDLETPFATTLEKTSAEEAWTDRGSITVELSPADALGRVPWLLRREDDPAAPRRAPFQWDIPHVYEIEHRLILPPGYAPPSLPPDRSTGLGPATLAERYRMDGRTVVVTFRFDSGKPRLALAELAALRKGLAEVSARPVKLAIEHTAWALSEAGKPKQAIAEVERLIRLHPTEAVHHTELALIYLHAGMGSAARRAARRAVELERSYVDAHVVLGWVLRRDTFGREYGFDHDRAGALAAYARARRLDPKHANAAAEHGELLERNARGEAFGPGADLPGAIEAWRAAYALQDTEEHGLALARALFQSGSFAEAERVLRAMPASEARDGLLVNVIAGGPGGAPAAIQLAGSMRTGAAKTKLLEDATQWMLYTRRYDAMRALLAHTGAASPGSQRHKISQRLDSSRPPPLGRDPKPLAFELTRVLFDPDRTTTAFWDAATAAELRPQAGLGMPLRGLEMPRDVFEDLMRASIEVTVTGSEAAWRLETSASGRQGVLYAALDRGVAKIIASDEHLPGLGRHVLRLVARGDLTTAAQCLDWLVKDAPRLNPLLGKLWGAGLPRDREAIALAGAVLAGGTDAEHVLPIVKRCASKLPDAREACDRAIGYTLFRHKRWRELEAHAAAWASRTADPQMATLARTDALTRLGRFDAAEAAIDALRAARPNDGDLAHMWTAIAIGRGDHAEAVRRIDAALQRPGAGPREQNEGAWYRLFTGTELPRALELARAAAGPDRTKARYAPLHTLAAVEAELGELHDAMLDGWQAMESLGSAAPAAPDWYVYGRIAEQLGLRDDAIAAYRRAAASGGPPGESNDLAKYRLGKLGARP